MILVVVAAGALLLARQALTMDVSEAVDAELAREAESLRSFSESSDPSTGRPYGDDIERMFELYLGGNAPAANEALLAFVNGRWSTRAGSDLPDDDAVSAKLPRDLRTIDVPAGGSVATSAGTLEYLAVPIRAGDSTVGVFVAGMLRDPIGLSLPGSLAMIAVLLAILICVAVGLIGRVISITLDSVGSVTKAALEAPHTEGRSGVRTQDHALAELEEAFNGVLQLRTDALAAQERFIHDAVYGLQAPIDTIRDHVERLQAHPRKEATRIPLVNEEVDRVKARLEELVLLARSVRPDFLEIQVADLGDILRQVRADMEKVAPRRWRIESVGPVRIVADPGRLSHALSRVAHHAVIGTRDDDLITLGSVVLPGEARLWVRHRDRGASARVDEVSSEEASSLRGVDDDTRMSLAIAEAIAKAHRGRLTVAGGPGGDVTITIVVPSDQPESWNGATSNPKLNRRLATPHAPGIETPRVVTTDRSS